MTLSKITAKFIKEIQKQKKHKAIFLNQEIIINPKVFPIDSPFSYSSAITAKHIPEKPGRVLDIGTGTGVQAIIAAKKGATQIVAIDIDDNAIQNAKDNVNKHNLQNKIIVIKSNLFENIEEKFNLIISQLPFADTEYEGEFSHFLCDSKFAVHEQLLSQAKEYLTPDGKILIPSGSIANEEKLLELIEKYEYNINWQKSEEKENIIWKVYCISSN
jgi:release factor glutamine methyltransferase